jgi:general stress protein YciG
MTGKPRGLANLTPERRREIASQGGSAVARHNRTFSKDPELARQAGQRGGKGKAAKPEPEPAAS